jgi:DNA-binding HxlR family transcriptional regulator
LPKSAGSWSDRAPQPGDAALALLEPEWTVGIVGALAGGPLRPAELQRLLAPIPHTTLIDRLGELERQGVLAGDDPADESSRSAKRALTERGRWLEEIVAEAALIERERPDAGEDRPAGERVLRLIADRYNRAIRRLLADGPLTQAAIERGLPGRSHSSVSRQLRKLLEAGAIAVGPEPSGHDSHRLVPYGRRLALLILHASRYDWRLDPRVQAPSDVGGLVHMIAPLARLKPGLEGACLLRVERESGELNEQEIHLTVARGKILVTALPPVVIHNATGSATAERWGNSFLRGEPTGIDAQGDRELLDAVVVALAGGLRG